MTNLGTRRWPGNVRQLRTFAERLTAFGPEEALRLLDSEGPATRTADPRATFKEAREQCVADAEREYFGALLQRVAGNVARAAEIAGVDRSYVYRLIERHGLRRGE